LIKHPGTECAARGARGPKSVLRAPELTEAKRTKRGSNASEAVASLTLSANVRRRGKAKHRAGETGLWLCRQGMLTSGRYSTLTWSLGEERIGSITLVAQHDGMRQLYRTKDGNGAPVEAMACAVHVHAHQVRRPAAIGSGASNATGGGRKFHDGRFFKCRLLPAAIRVAEPKRGAARVVRVKVGTSIARR
jgi:hypothetical protein